MRECTKCLQEKSVEDYYVRVGRLTRQCKDCEKALTAAWAKAHPERRRNPEAGRAQVARYAAAHPERVAARQREYRKNNRDHLSARQREYRKNNREACAAYMRRWRAANPEKARAIGVNKDHRRRAAFSGVVRDFTVAQWEEMKAAHEYRCAYCHEEKPLTQDHIVPIAKGGAHTRDNVAPACRSCNSSKRNHDLLPWLSARSTTDLQPRCF